MRVHHSLSEGKKRSKEHGADYSDDYSDSSTPSPGNEEQRKCLSKCINSHPKLTAATNNCYKNCIKTRESGEQENLALLLITDDNE